MADKILDLPDELLLSILDLARPGDFESLALSCRRLYRVAGSLIQDHNLCKRAILDESLNYALHDFRKVLNVQSMLNWLSRLPARNHLDALRYFTNTIWCGPTAETPHSYSDRDLIKTLCREEEDLQALLLDMESKASELYLQQFEDSDPALLEPYPHSTATDLSFYLLPYMYGIESLALQRRWWSLANVNLLMRILSMNAGGHRNLKQIWLSHASGMTPTAAAPLFSLPFLEILTIEEFRSEDFHYRRSIPPGIFAQSPLKCLCLLKSSWHYEDLTNLLRQLPCLTSLIWVDYIDLVRDERKPRELFDYAEWDGEPIEDDELDFGNQDSSNKTYGPIKDDTWKYGTRFEFQANKLLNTIAQTHGSKLRQLSITLCSYYPSQNPISRWSQIVHFRQFQNLAFLEIDVRTLRPRRGANSPEFPQLRKIVPPSVEALALRMHNDMRIETFDWLNGIVEHKSAFPVLHTIKIGWKAHDGIPSEWRPVIETLTVRMSAVNIRMQFVAHAWDNQDNGFLLGFEGTWPKTWDLMGMSARSTHDFGDQVGIINDPDRFKNEFSGTPISGQSSGRRALARRRRRPPTDNPATDNSMTSHPDEGS